MAFKPPVEVPQGAIRLNTDTQKLEFYAQDQWWEMATEQPQSGSQRGCWTAGNTPSSPNGTNMMQYVQINTLGNTVDFGDLTYSTRIGSSFSSSTRGIMSGGWAPGNTNTCKWEYASLGNAVGWGSLNRGDASLCGGCGNQERGFIGGGYPGNDSISVKVISSGGNFTDFGNLVASRQGSYSGIASRTRGLFLTGSDGQQYITMASTGNAVSFGSLANGSAGTGASNATRGLWMGCSGSKVDYITIATTGTAREFGDANVAETYLGCMASPTRALQGTGASATNTIVYYNIATTGNYTDFGDQTAGRAQDTGTSNAHGGLG